MKQFKNILLVYECDSATLDRAATLASNNQARLTVVQVVRELPEQWRRMKLGSSQVDLQSLAIKECRLRLEEIVAPLKQKGVRASSRVLVGTPFLEIIREVIASERDLVIMTAEGKGGVKERLFGSTSLHLMRKCPCPVWVMKPSLRKRYPRILAAVDPDPANTMSESLNATILQLASSLAAQDEAELHVIHAWTLLYEGLLRGRGGLVDADIRNYVNEEESRHRRLLNDLLSSHAVGPAKVHLVDGPAGQVIPEFTRTENVDLLVMGSVCRSGIPGFFIGNTAEKILDEVDCSVLTVKPVGFESPVKLA